METALKYGKLITTISKKGVDTEVALFTPFIQIMGILGYFMSLATSLVSLKIDYIMSILGLTLLGLTIAALVMIGTALVYVTRPTKTRNLLWLPFVFGYWLVENFVALYALFLIVLRRPKKWVKTMKNGTINYERNNVKKLETHLK